jgi:predicted O-methyltransferase YrrM
VQQQQSQGLSVVASSVSPVAPITALKPANAAASFEGSFIPLPELLEIRRRLKGFNPLFPQGWDQQAEAPILERPFVQQIGGFKFNGYCLEPAGLMFLASVVRRRRPRVILECGAGISTLFLADVLREVHGNNSDIRYLTLEEGADVAAKMTASIAAAGFQRFAKVINLPLAETMAGGRRTMWYDLDDAQLRDVTGGQPIDMILLDGPSGNHGSRFAAVPLLHPHARNGACFFLDDALRDNELEIGRQWSELPYVELLGLKAVGKGMLAGLYSL